MEENSNRNLFFAESIAGAVAREIRRMGQYSEVGLPCFDGDAYKAAWDRKGSNALKHIESARCDASVMNICVNIATCRRLGIPAIV